MGKSHRDKHIWQVNGLLLIQTLGTNFGGILSEINAFFFPEAAFENVVCDMLAILSRSYCV